MQIRHEYTDGLADPIRAILLHEVLSGYGYFGLVGPGPAELARPSGEQATRSRLDEELGKIGAGQPPSVVIDNLDDVCWMPA